MVIADNTFTADQDASGLELAIVIPTFNEHENVVLIIEHLARALDGINYEVIIVDDDSPDGTARLVCEIARCNRQVRVVQRIWRRGLASACVEGMMSTAAPYIAVMDADLQHDERILPAMLAKIRGNHLDLVVATRNAPGGGMGEFAQRRVFLSNLGVTFSRWISGTQITDPMSGFFVVSRDFMQEVARSVSAIGFKILLDLITSARRPIRIAEVPYKFRNRLHGDSKLDVKIGLEFIQLLLDKRIGDFVPVRFLSIAAMEGVGIALSGAALYILVALCDARFMTAQILVASLAITGSFLLNNILSYRDRRLRGRAMLIGLATFFLGCSFGVIVNLSVAVVARQRGASWSIAGICGLVVGAVWNSGISWLTAWRRSKRRTSISARYESTASATVQRLADR